MFGDQFGNPALVPRAGSSLVSSASGSPSPIILGRYASNAGLGSVLPYEGERHLLLFGPNGSGKGLSLIHI